ncbi:MAG: hypothetical protein M3032_10420 [Verrucomicrobiota bacterium]|nr:hypothetical protein [Verrucomicrobiota bacterium]
MLALVVGAVVMLGLGATLLREILNPREHPVWFISYWLACAWLTISMLLLAVFDLLLVRAQARAARKDFARKLVQGGGADGSATPTK